jgi:hypothetical protein
MADTWGLNAWFAEGEDKKNPKRGDTTKKGAGHIVQLKTLLTDRLASNGVSGKKVKGMETHLDDQDHYEKKAKKAAMDGKLSEKDAELYTGFFSKPQRERNYDEWEKVKKRWEELDATIYPSTRRDIQAYIDGYNKATKFIIQAEEKALEEGESGKEGRDLSWVSEMISKCDEMIAIINKADPSFRESKLRNR